MTPKKIVLSSDHAAIELRQAVASHIADKGFDVVESSPLVRSSYHAEKHL